MIFDKATEEDWKQRQATGRGQTPGQKGARPEDRPESKQAQKAGSRHPRPATCADLGRHNMQGTCTIDMEFARLARSTMGVGST